MATAQDVFAFRARFPVFASASDADVAIQIDAADAWLDPAMWEPNDFKWARWYLAAHWLTLEELWGAGGGASSESGTTTVGMSDLYVRQIRMGERMVSFGERQAFSKAEQSAGPGQGLMEATIYGQKYLMLRARNVPRVAIV